MSFELLCHLCYLSKITSHQIKLDKHVSDLLLSIAVAIAATGEIRAFDQARTLDSLDQSIRSLVDLLIEIIIFIREYLHHSFVGKGRPSQCLLLVYGGLVRAGHFEYGTKIDDFEKRLTSMKDDFQIGMDAQTLEVGSRALKLGDESLFLQKLQSQ